MGFEREITSSAKRMVAWLRSLDDDGAPRVEVRRYTDGFLHGKAYIADHPKMPGVIAGSSNFTYAGLHQNAELNLGYPAGEHTDKVIDWFDHYWDQSDPYDLAALYARQWAAHSPWTVFLRMLHELYGEHLDEEQTPDTGLRLTRFQSDGVRRMQRLLDDLGGVLVADEVGLGKTYLAGEVIRRMTDESRQRVLVIAPAALKENVWVPFIEQFRLTKVMSYEEVRNRVDSGDADFLGEIEDTAMVVIDEAHNLRNANAARSAAIDRVILAGKHPKKVVLLTATPVNNSLTDLETLVRYFVRDDAHFASIGIPSIRQYIKNAQSLDPDALTPEHLFNLMDQVAVRRTRRFVKDNYPGERIVGPGGKMIPVRFPKPVASRIDYALTPLGIELIDQMLEALDRPGDLPIFASAAEQQLDPRRLTLARYTSSAYLLRGEAEGFQITNAGLLRSALLKRLESSPHALLSTLDTLVAAHDAFLDGLAKGYVLKGEALRDWGSSESDDLEEFVQHLDHRFDGQVEDAAVFHLDALRQAVESDVRLLLELRATTARSIEEEDSKAERLVEELTRIAQEARAVDPSGLGVSAGDRRKVIVFSTFADTIVKLHEHVMRAIEQAAAGSPLADYRGRVPEPVMGAYKSTVLRGDSGSVDQGGRKRVIEGFAPATAGKLRDDGTPIATDEYDLLLTTDVLAEGVNLQQAGRIVNYDLPWNPMRIVQRHGRVDRIGSAHETVQLGLFFPTERLDEMLRLEATLERKLAQADAAVGAGEVLPGRSSVEPMSFNADERVAEIEDLLEKRGSSAALSGEEYRRRLFKAFEGDQRLGDSVRELPFGSGSGFVHPRLKANGYVFCVKIADQPTPWFRYVECDEEWRPTGRRSSDDTLASLIAADPEGPATQRVLSDEAYERAFDAWTVARDDVFATWTRLTDPGELAPVLPPAFRDARQLVGRSGRFLPPEERNDLRGKLGTVPTAKVRRAVRAALSEPGDDEVKIRAVQRVVAEAGLQVAPVPKPLPPVSEAEVRLVCWMAVQGAARSGA